ncbi:zinc finger (C3HC4-type RING finger) family protein [Artemisia annua]|uniref:Zinc finger (C3HC4-type RING finger) family protein n=1 Tax=Artemisia annua TaxID=35608 RepID=A0A2U1M452_ARTAN|nr:zinc finger (C3HC4-type RING finger) family protein [Artemisia annua]
MESSSQQDCAICMGTVEPKNGRAIFTAECSHSFHFDCIASNVKHGNRVCPVCRASWKEIPFQDMPPQQTHFGPSFPLPPQQTHFGPSFPLPPQQTHFGPSFPLPPQQTLFGPFGPSFPLPPQQTHSSRNVPPRFQAQEPSVFDDDEPVNQESEEMHSGNSDSDGGIEIKTYTEIPAVAKSEKFDDFGILINIKAPVTQESLNSRTPIDLVTILDISGSMMGSKIALLKQAMGFVVQNLGPSDRLSVISFSSSARRLFPLRRMTEIGKQESQQMINSLVADGGTDIAEALKKGSKVMTDRKFKNPVSGMILLSDGQDNYIRGPFTLPDNRIPIHTFGFGADHDANLLYSISEQSGGMFSFIEAENVIQDAFAQCIGGLLSVVVQELRVEVECVHPALRLGSIKAGSYKVGMDGIGRSGFIEVGDLYAEEVRDFLISMDIPVNESENEMPLLKFRFIHKDPLRNILVTIEGNEVTILRPETVGNQTVSLEVDRQRNRLRVAGALAEARVAAENRNHTEATMLLRDCQRSLLGSASARGGDQYGARLADELGVIMEGTANHTAYEAKGRANMLSGWGAHSTQRAAFGGGSTTFGGSMQAYQTPAMLGMVKASQAAPPKYSNREEAVAHAEQNERLPIQSIVQLLYIEHLRLRNALGCNDPDDNYKLPVQHQSWRINNGGLSAAMSPKDNYASLRRENRELKLELTQLRMRLNDLSIRLFTMQNFILRLTPLEGPPRAATSASLALERNDFESLDSNDLYNNPDHQPIGFVLLSSWQQTTDYGVIVFGAEEEQRADYILGFSYASIMERMKEACEVRKRE